jgi:hypothetical protein
MSSKRAGDSGLHGLIAEFDSAEAVVAAARRAREAGYRRMDGYTPFPVEPLWEALGHHSSRLPYMVLAGGVLGLLGGFALQYWVSAVDYPLNVGGRPLNSWPSFIPITFETTVLLAAFTAVFGMLALNGLPRPYHPVFNAERFQLASRDRYFLCIEADDPRFDREATAAFLRTLNPTEVMDVET